MNKVLVIIFVILLLFFDDNILAILGYPHFDVKAGTIFKVHPVSYLSLLIIIFFVLTGKIKYSGVVKNCRRELELIIVCICIFLYLAIVGRLSNVAFIIDALLTPAIISILFYYTPEKVMLRQKWLVYVAFSVNALLALYEKLKHKPLLSREYISETESFRATALYGHPLNNALIMSIIGIILYFSFDKLILKVAALLVTILSLFCFGARGGVIGIVIGVLLGVIVDLFSKRIQQSSRTIFIAILVFATGLVVLFNTKLGDRILNKVSFSNDESALERVRTLNLLSLMDSSQLQWGMSDSDMEVLMSKGGVHKMENYLVVWIARFGMYIAMAMLIVLILFIIKHLKKIDKLSVFPMLFAILFVASINNSLASKTRAVSILVLCCYALKKAEPLQLKKPVVKYKFSR